MIGILGGTFDPIHFGHLRPALDLLQALRLTEVRLVPLNVAVHRVQPVATAAQRLEMARAAVAGEPGLSVDAREIHRPGGSFSYDTLLSLRAELGPRRPLCFLTGADAFRDFLTWHRPLDILGLAHVVVMERPGAGKIEGPALRRLLAERRADGRDALAAAPGGRILCCPVTALDISATRLRDLIAGGLSPRYLLPDPVLALIRREGLYGSVRMSGLPLAEDPLNYRDAESAERTGGW